MTQQLPPLPPRVARLPRDYRGFPVPWFVQWFVDDKPATPGDGAPDFRVADSRKLKRAIGEARCWVCGDILGKHKAFTIGPMCAVNRVSSEPPAHRDCAIFSAVACPFLTKPRMRRNEKDLPEARVDPAGIPLRRNPGVACIWLTGEFALFVPPSGGVLFSLGEPNEVLWFAEGRTATRAEVIASIESGYPALLDMAKAEGAVAVHELERQRERAMPFVPAA